MHHLKRLANRILPLGSRRRELARKVYRRASGIPSPASQASYHQWIEKVEPTIVSPLARDGFRPLISIIVPAYNTPDKYLNPLVDSILVQTYGKWELVLVDASPDPERAAAIHVAAQQDKRIRPIKLGKNLGIAQNTNVGIEQARGEFIALLDHDDTLAPFALNEVVVELQAHPDTDWLYSDEDKLSDGGTTRSMPFFKPGWSPDLLLGVNYVTHFCVVRTELARRVGGMRPGYEGAQDYDFALRLMDEQPRVRHVSKILYHWRLAQGSTAIAPSLKDKADDAGRRALSEYVQRNKIKAEVMGIPEAPTNYRLRYATPGHPRASLIIPIRNQAVVTQAMLDSVLEKTTYPNYEILLIVSVEAGTAQHLASLKNSGPIKVLVYDHPFSWPAINNFGRKHATGDILVFLSDDLEVITPTWLDELVGAALQPEVGAVSGMLLYPDNTIYHAGVILGFCGTAGHVFRRLRPSTFTYFGLADWPRNYLALRGACLVVEAAKFDQVGGFDEKLHTGGSDVVFGITLYKTGYRNVYWPFARLLHYEDRSGGGYGSASDDQHNVAESIKSYWPYLEHGDPYYNPNLDLTDPQAEQIKLGGLG